jgi:hypothetical protein
MRDKYSDRPLPEEVKRLIEEPLVPFEQLEPYDPVNNLYELDERSVDGNHKVHQFLKKVGNEMIVLTQVETGEGAKLFEVKTPNDKANDRLIHTFASAPLEEVQFIFPTAA